MKPREAVKIRAQSVTRQWSIPSRLTLTVLPLVVVSVLVGLLVVWSLVSGGLGSSNTLAAWIAIASGMGLAAVGTLVAVQVVGRSMSRRIEEVSSATRRVATRDLLELLEALRNPEPDLSSIPPVHLDTEPGDEIGDLARSFQQLHASLIEVGSRQMEAMRAGVSSIFVTLARRNSSLVDRQLALLDELESGEEDSEVLAGFYQLDHLAARMRRNAESLLVLAGSASPRVWARATDMSDVVRAAVSEIDEYQRIEVLAVEPARLAGGAVSDVSHLLAELLENAIQFSPPSETIRVTGLFDMEGYQIAVSDRGVGMSEARIAEMNRILDRPPALGLAVEPTLGMYVVARLAQRHGLGVELIRGVPGVTVRVTIPRSALEVETGVAPRLSGQTDRRSIAARRQDARQVHRMDVAMSGSAPARADQAGGEEHVEIIDLTEDRYRDLDGELDAPGELPVRTPGMAYNDENDDDQVVSAGEGGSKLRAALSEYDRGRRSAVDVGEAEAARVWNDPESEEPT